MKIMGMVNSQDYRWNFSNSQVFSYFGKDNINFGNQVSDLKSLSTDSTFKAYGKISKWISSGEIFKGTCVRITFNSGSLFVETYDNNSSNILEQDTKAALLGIALNDATDGDEVCLY